MNAESKYQASLLLSAIADALGWITEFEKNENDLLKRYNQSKITSFHKWKKNVGGRFLGYVDHMDAGSYSDDTQMLLLVARSIRNNGNVDQNYFANIELPFWLEYSRGAGRTVKNAARKITRKSATWNNNFFTYKIGKTTVDYRNSGANGAAMRILPIALANFGDQEKINEEIFANSIITHGHPRAILGAQLYGFCINQILKYRPENFDFLSFITEIGKDIEKNFALDFLRKPALAQWINKWNIGSGLSFEKCYAQTVLEVRDYLRGIYQRLVKNSKPKEVLKYLGCFAPETKGSGISTVIGGIYLACKFHNKPIEGVTEAVNSLGSDTDSIAAFVGGLLGALHGQSIIPKKWKDVQDFDYLKSVASDLLKISLGESLNFVSDKRILVKYKFVLGEIKEGNTINFPALGLGRVTNVDKQNALTKGKLNLIYDVNFEIGQSCRFSKLLSVNDEITKTLEITKSENDLDIRISKFASKIPKELQEEFNAIINNIRTKN